ncbi:radical SAM protein [Streptomyces sp. Z26]|uniref:radical SAM protein n=1 Tax=Streptomyces sp. Z26 TaxID=2500177 RepID=UPI000EF135BF|nr:radical SAM protein [Streptomyces sp. Z26]RLL66669.1 radical SAM protein [Streptomyces sp. Z26]
MFQHHALRQISSDVPVRVSMDRTLRVKVIDACGLTCTFCHNEGTPVSADNPGRRSVPFASAGRSGRTSIYLGSNGARFLSAPIVPDESFRTALSQLRDALGFDEVHLTGGEPTLHPRLAQIITLARGAGYSASVTSNGENGARSLPECARAGLDHANFSIFGTTSEELAQVQDSRYRSRRRATHKIMALEQSIRLASSLGIGVRANIVIPDHSHIPRVHRLLERYSPRVSVRVLTSLADGPASLDAVGALLDQLDARPEEVHLIAGTSGFRIAYRLPDGQRLVVKHIRPLRLLGTCTRCPLNNSTDCQEGYYGVRLYRDREGVFHVGVCIQRMDLCLSVEEFVDSQMCAEVRRTREQDLRELQALTA